MFKFAALAALVSIIPLINAQSPIYGQCGGINWTGPTTCVAGTTCTVLNDWYYQCLPGSSSTPPPSTKPPVSSSTAKPVSSSTKPVTTSTTPVVTPTTSSAPASTPTVAAGNPFSGYTIQINPVYQAEVVAALPAITDAGTKASAAKVETIPTFFWLDAVARIPTLDTYMAAAAAAGGKRLVQIVIYDLPNRDCHAKASNGEFTIANNGAALYKTTYIDAIVAIIKKYPSVRVVAVIEPDSLANLVTNLSDPNCAAAQSVYLSSVTYAMQQLTTVGVIQYLDAGHAGWLGWPANLTPAAQLFASLYQSAGKPAGVRGLATNVANYNALVAVTPDPITQGNPNYDEIHYINALSPALQASGFPDHFIVDQSRSGQQNLRQQWGDWCNIKGAGFGTRPTTNTGSALIDSIVWVKPGGESDGTSNTSAARYDPTCSLPDATVPAPEAGTWFQAFFQTLVTAANPPL